MRKLVLLDKDGALTEIDRKALRREALALKAYINQAPFAEAYQFDYRGKLLPLVEAALNGTVKVLYKESGPYNTLLMREGLEPPLPPEAHKRYVDFLLRIQGNPPPVPPRHPRRPGWPLYSRQNR